MCDTRIHTHIPLHTRIHTRIPTHDAHTHICKRTRCTHAHAYIHKHTHTTKLCVGVHVWVHVTLRAWVAFNPSCAGYVYGCDAKCVYRRGREGGGGSCQPNRVHGHNCTITHIPTYLTQLHHHTHTHLPGLYLYGV